MKPRSCEAAEDDHVVIECKIVGEPKPQILWLRDRLKVIFSAVYCKIKVDTLHNE